jgi:hypothetical protein
MNQLFTLQHAVLTARERLNDKTIGTRVEDGRVQIVRVTYPNGAVSVVTPASEWVSADEAVRLLKEMQ